MTTRLGNEETYSLIYLFCVLEKDLRYGYFSPTFRFFFSFSFSFLLSFYSSFLGISLKV